VTLKIEEPEETLLANSLSRKHLLVISQDVRGHGGVNRHVWSVIGALEDQGYSTELATIATSWRDSVSLRVLSPKSWWSKTRSISIEEEVLGLRKSWTHYGGRFVELGWLRYQPRGLLDTRLQHADGVVVVCGTAQFAGVLRNIKAPTIICAATTLRDERGASGFSSKRLKRVLIAIWSITDRRLETASLRGCDAIIAQSKTSATLLATLSHRSVTVAPMGYPDPGPLEPQSKKVQQRVHFLAVGRIDDPRKRVDILLEAYRMLRLKRTGVPNLIIATGTTPNASTRRLVESLGLREYVNIEVGVTDERLNYLYRHAFALLHAADQEGLGLIVLEAMSAGVPVVCTRCGGPEDILRNGVDGLLVDRRKPQAICDAALWILNNPETAEEMGQAGAQRVRDEWHPRVGREIFLSIARHVFGSSTGALKEVSQ
jgi:glycosyltransferase involved in cell wall biosynthesis